MPNQNLTVTFRNISKKKKSLMREVIALVNKMKIKSAGIQDGGFDINDKKTYSVLSSLWNS